MPTSAAPLVADTAPRTSPLTSPLNARPMTTGIAFQDVLQIAARDFGRDKAPVVSQEMARDARPPRADRPMARDSDRDERRDDGDAGTVSAAPDVTRDERAAGFDRSQPIRDADAAAGIHQPRGESNAAPPPRASGQSQAPATSPRASDINQLPAPDLKPRPAAASAPTASPSDPGSTSPAANAATQTPAVGQTMSRGGAVPPALQAVAAEQAPAAKPGQAAPTGRREGPAIPSSFVDLVKSDSSIALTMRQATTATLVTPTASLSPALAASLNQQAGVAPSAADPASALNTALSPGPVTGFSTQPGATIAGKTPAFGGTGWSAGVASSLSPGAPASALLTGWPVGAAVLGPPMPGLAPAGLLAGSLATASSPPSAAASVASGSAVEQVSVHIAKAAGTLPTTIDIDLKPETLGRVEVRLDLTRDGHVTVHIRADTAETLDVLRAESASLERALADAGLESDSGGLQFDLKDSRQQLADDEAASRRRSSVPGESEDAIPEPVASNAWGGTADLASGRLDIHA